MDRVEKIMLELSKCWDGSQSADGTISTVHLDTASIGEIATQAMAMRRAIGERDRRIEDLVREIEKFRNGEAV